MGRLSHIVAAALSLAAASAKSIVDLPLQVRQTNVMRISRKECDECTTLESFYEEHHLGFVLFFERQLVGSHKYKEAVVRGFHEACEDMKFSHLVCGVVDMVEDREYAERYIDPKTAPAHIIVRGGEPIPVHKTHMEVLMKKPGDKATVIWHLHQMLAPQDTPSIAQGALRLATDASDPQALKTALDAHEIVLVGTVAEDKGKSARDTLKAAFHDLVVKKEIPSEVEVLPHPDLDRVRKKKRLERITRQQGRIVFVVAHGQKVMKEYNLSEGSAVAFVKGQQLPSSETFGEGRLDIPRAAEAMRTLTFKAIKKAKELQVEELANRPKVLEADSPIDEPEPGRREGKGRRPGKGRISDNADL